MYRQIPVFLIFLVLACTNRQDKLSAGLASLDSFISTKQMLENTPDSMKKRDKFKTMAIKAKLLFDKIPDSMALKMHAFAMEFPQNPKSELYLYTATQISERGGRFFETAKWCEDYVNKYPKGKYRLGAITAAGANFEKSGSFEKAIEFYEKLSKEDPNSELGKGAARNVQMLKMGLTTPEQQLEYLLKQKDSTKGE